MTHIRIYNLYLHNNNHSSKVRYLCFLTFQLYIFNRRHKLIFETFFLDLSIYNLFAYNTYFIPTF